MLGSSALWLGAALEPALYVAGAAASFLVYHAERAYFGGPEDEIAHPDRTRWLQEHPRFSTGALGAAGLATLVCGLLLSPHLLSAGLALGLLSIFYAAPLLPRRWRAKQHPLLKVGLIATAWTGFAVGLPALQVPDLSVGAIGLFAVYRCGWFLLNAMQSDWVDRAGDEQVGLRIWASQRSEREVERAIGWLLAGTAAAGAVLLWKGVGAWFLLDVVGLLLLMPAGWRRLPRRVHAFYLDVAMLWPGVAALIVAASRGISA